MIAHPEQFMLFPRNSRGPAAKLMKWSGTLILVCILNGCHSAADAGKSSSAQPSAENQTDSKNKAMKKDTKKGTVRSLIVSRQNAGRLGTVQFDEANKATLSTEGSGPAVEELKNAWQEMMKAGKLSRVITVQENRNGKKITALEEEQASPGEDNYFYAVLDTLSRKYGFAVDIAK